MENFELVFPLIFPALITAGLAFTVLLPQAASTISAVGAASAIVGILFISQRHGNESRRTQG